MKLSPTSLPGVFVVERSVHGDDRGSFTRLFCVESLQKAGWKKPVAQVNFSFSRAQGTVRGMHFQHAPFAEMKLVACLQGEIWDVAVDLRRDSPTFLQWHGERLSGSNHRSLLVPEGCAHGFQTLTESCEVVYCHSEMYTPAKEGGVRHDDPALGITWPLPVRDVSQRDLAFPLIQEGFTGL